MPAQMGEERGGSRSACAALFSRRRGEVYPGNQPIHTTPDGWAHIIAEFVHQEGFDTINVVLATESTEQITPFATEVTPAARTAIASTTPWE